MVFWSSQIVHSSLYYYVNSEKLIFQWYFSYRKDEKCEEIVKDDLTIGFLKCDNMLSWND